MPKLIELRRDRRGKGVLPPNPTRWEHEHNALDLRHELSLPLDARLSHQDAFNLLPNVLVLSHLELQIDDSIKAHFNGARSGRWSGMCVQYPSGTTLVMYNGHHPERRIRATLMEEFFHLWLDHPTERLRLLGNGEGRRQHDATKESEAYGSGAAALVPYQPLKAMLAAGRIAREIADHFLVSEPLVQFRMRVSRLKQLAMRKC